MNPSIIEVDLQSFQTEVAEKSKTMPVVLEFYAEGAEQCAAPAALLQQLVAEYQGKFLLARVNIQTNQPLVQQLGVRTLPCIKVVFQGQMAADMEGPMDEAQLARGLRELLDKLTLSPTEMIREQIDVLIAQGARQEAIQLLQQMIAQEPTNYVLHVELCDLLIQEGQADEARKIMPSLPADTQGIERPASRLAFMDEAAGLPEADALRSTLAGDESNLQARYELAVKLVVDGQAEAALEELLALLKLDRAWEEEKARTTMIRVFDMLGKGNELATSYRRKMFTFLH